MKPVSRQGRLLLALALIVVLGLLLSACGGPSASSLAEPQRLPGMPYVPAGTAQEYRTVHALAWSSR